MRREFPVLGTGDLEVIPSANPSVLAFVRSAPDLAGRGPVNPVLCVHNVSRLAQPAELHVERWIGRQPIELLGRVAFPLIRRIRIRPHWRPTGHCASSWPERATAPR